MKIANHLGLEFNGIFIYTWQVSILPQITVLLKREGRILTTNSSEEAVCGCRRP